MSDKQLKDIASILMILAKYDHKDAIGVCATAAKILWEKDTWETVLGHLGKSYAWETPSFVKKGAV